MAYEHKDGSGSMFKNDKGDNPNRPDYRGDFMLDGTLYEISGWIKPKASNPSEKFMSLSVKPKQQAQGKPQPKQAASDFNDDVPF